MDRGGSAESARDKGTPLTAHTPTKMLLNTWGTHDKAMPYQAGDKLDPLGVGLSGASAATLHLEVTCSADVDKAKIRAGEQLSNEVAYEICKALLQVMLTVTKEMAKASGKRQSLFDSANSFDPTNPLHANAQKGAEQDQYAKLSHGVYNKGFFPAAMFKQIAEEETKRKAEEEAKRKAEEAKKQKLAGQQTDAAAKQEAAAETDIPLSKLLNDTSAKIVFDDLASAFVQEKSVSTQTYNVFTGKCTETVETLPAWEVKEHDGKDDHEGCKVAGKDVITTELWTKGKVTFLVNPGQLIKVKLTNRVTKEELIDKQGLANKVAADEAASSADEKMEDAADVGAEEKAEEAEAALTAEEAEAALTDVTLTPVYVTVHGDVEPEDTVTLKAGDDTMFPYPLEKAAGEEPDSIRWIFASGCVLEFCFKLKSPPAPPAAPPAAPSAEDGDWGVDLFD